jgi:hypothetical protein
LIERENPTFTAMKSRFHIVIALGWLLALPAIAAESAIPPFVAEGRLLTQEFRTDTNLNYRTDARVIFLYSNGWWQVEARFTSSNLVNPVVVNCMKIPDGTRSFIIIEGSTNTGLTTLATACPISFPPPGQSELLVPWLALCPQRELPLLDRRRMRRFINLVDCRPNVFNSPQNEGFYQVAYLAPENAFLSELVLTNNGFSIELNVHKSGVEDTGEIMRFGPPFENGFTEMQYRIIESTNLHGVTFPIRAICKRFAPNWERKDPSDLRVVLRSELTVTKISFSEKDMAGRIAAPSKMIANDLRPGVRIDSYFIHDDQWKPVSDPEIARRVRIARQGMGSHE